MAETPIHGHAQVNDFPSASTTERTPLLADSQGPGGVYTTSSRSATRSRRGKQIQRKRRISAEGSSPSRSFRSDREDLEVQRCDHQCCSSAQRRRSPSSTESGGYPAPDTSSAESMQSPTEATTRKTLHGSHDSLLLGLTNDAPLSALDRPGILSSIIQSVSLRLENSGSVARDHLASERTFLAYMRTSLAIVSSGVALVQLFSAGSASTPQGSMHRLHTYIRPLGASTVIIGLFILFVGSMRYFTVQAALTKGYFPVTRIATGLIAFMLATLITLTFGILLAVTGLSFHIYRLLLTQQRLNTKMPSERRTKTAKAKQSLQRKPTPSKTAFNWQVLTLGVVLSILTALYYSHWSGILNVLSQSPQSIPSQKDAPIMRDEVFHVVDIPGKGKGALAARDIKQGELILREKPLFVVPRNINASPPKFIYGELHKLPPEGQQAFLNLSYVNFPQGLDPEDHPEEVALATFQTNAVSAGENVGLFPRMARINHGCSSAFNVVYNWREWEGQLVVHALKDIPKGKELLATYTNTKRPRDERRAFLSQQYGFHCTCDVCSLTSDLSRASDARLTEISRLYDEFAAWGSDIIDGAQAIEFIRKIWKIEDEEGYWSERGQLAADAAWVAASHSDATATQAWARRAGEWFSYEIGADTPQVMEMSMFASRPESHKAWGTKRRQNVGGPDRSRGE
ncbi:unnamed protein product [Cyclocybe aegerita]|uniref:SET domain-containing protein n=1 Tax=Cyclocybe aegerita TaxID=1973307 RepID=A0A8S0WXS5_CYCAE|nr:unnamed protein product [Cyclocybe aegerita]